LTVFAPLAVPLLGALIKWVSTPERPREAVRSSLIEELEAKGREVALDEKLSGLELGVEEYMKTELLSEEERIENLERGLNLYVQTI
jgi:hypothetical protein